MISVLVVDDQPLVRDGIASLLDTQPDLRVVAAVGDGLAAVEAVKGHRPDVALVDVRMPGLDGIETARRILLIEPKTTVIMLTTFDDVDYVDRALVAGASGYLLKNLPASKLAAAIRLADAGVAPFDLGIVERLRSAPESAPRGATVEHAPLTAREREVLRLIARGASNREVAQELFVSVGTVKNHVSSILNTLGLRDRTQAAIFARNHGLDAP